MVETAADLAAKAATGQFTAAEFRDRLDNGRKVAIQILEFFDRHGVTLRRGDLRRINKHRLDLFRRPADQQPPTPNSGRESSPVGRPDFKSGRGREPVFGGFELPLSSANIGARQMTATSFLEDLRAAARDAEAAEAGFRREVAARIADLEQQRAFAFRRLNLMQAIAEAVGPAEDEPTAMAYALAALRARLNWESDSEARAAVLARFAPVAQAVFASLMPATTTAQPMCRGADAVRDVVCADAYGTVLDAVRALHSGDPACRFLSASPPRAGCGRLQAGKGFLHKCSIGRPVRR